MLGKAHVKILLTECFCGDVGLFDGTFASIGDEKVNFNAGLAGTLPGESCSEGDFGIDPAAALSVTGAFVAVC